MNSESCTESVSPHRTAQNWRADRRWLVFALAGAIVFHCPRVGSWQNCTPKRFELRLSFRAFNRLDGTSMRTSGTKTTDTSGSAMLEI